MHNKLQIIYKHNKPYGIRDENGYLFFFTEVAKWSGQEERYRQEVQEQFALADYLLASLQARGLTPLAPDVLPCGHPKSSLVRLGFGQLPYCEDCKRQNAGKA